MDTSLDRSKYLALCGDPSAKPLLCGGRFLTDDVVDVTYNYLRNDAGTTKDSPLQVRALTSDGVMFSTENADSNADSLSAPDPSNRQQGHPAVSMVFPYGRAVLNPQGAGNLAVVAATAPRACYEREA